MVVHVEGVVRRALVKTAHASKFGNSGAHELGITDERVAAMAGDEDSLELDAHTLAGDLVEQRRTFGEGLRRGRVHGKVESAGKAHRTQHAQRVLLKTATGLTHSANLTTLQIAATVVAVEQASGGVPGHGVHREVATREVIFDARCTLDVLGMAAIGVKAVEPICRDFDALAIHHGRNATELDARFHDRDAARTQGSRAFLPRSAAADVDIVPRGVHQGVAHPAAHDPRLEPSSLKRRQDGQGSGTGLGAHQGLTGESDIGRMLHGPPHSLCLSIPTRSVHPHTPKRPIGDRYKLGAHQGLTGESDIGRMLHGPPHSLCLSIPTRSVHPHTPKRPIGDRYKLRHLA